MKTFTLLTALVAIVAVTDAATMRKMFVLHRHGARTPQGVVNGILDCNMPYCRLTNFGKAQCFAIGKELWKDYGPSFLHQHMPDGYNVTQMQSVSTDVPRVVLSAQSVVLGMFENALPFVDFVPREDDLQMSYWNSWPAWKIWNAGKNILPKLNPLANKMFKDINGVNYLQRFKEFSGLIECDTDPQACVTFMDDKVSSALANNMSIPADIVAVRPQLLEFTAQWFAALLGYDPETEPEKKQIGSFGYPLARAAVDMLTAAPEKGHFDYKLIHRGGHDWTIFAFYSALGTWQRKRDEKNTRFVVQFAETVIFELWEKTQAEFDASEGAKGGSNRIDGKDYGTLVIKAKYWVPTQPTQLQYNYSVTKNALPIQCLTTDASKAYMADECAVGDLLRQIESTAGESDDNICYWTRAQLEAEDCLTNDAPTNERCLFFRQRCPDAPCGTLKESIADPAAGYKCVSLSVKEVQAMAVASVVAVAIAALVIGAVAGYVVGGHVVMKLVKPKRASLNELPRD